MPRYGFCSECKQSVWLDKYGACPNGHGYECISGVTEAGPPAPVYVPHAVEPQKKSKLWYLALFVVLVPALVWACGMVGAAMMIPKANSMANDARGRACVASQRVMEGGYEMWLAESPDNVPALIPDYATLQATLLAEGIINESPTCPSGGTYSFSNGGVTCSIHGSE